MQHTAEEYKEACEKILETAVFVGKRHDEDPVNEEVFQDLPEGDAVIGLVMTVIEVDAKSLPIMGQVTDVNRDVIERTLRWYVTYANWNPANKNKGDALVLSRLATIVSYFIMCSAQICFGLDSDDLQVYYIGLHPDSPYCVKLALPPA